jgi:hypothetical protein
MPASGTTPPIATFMCAPAWATDRVNPLATSDQRGMRLFFASRRACGPLHTTWPCPGILRPWTSTHF